MAFLLKLLIALVIGSIAGFIMTRVCLHFGIDPFWGWICGVIAGLVYLLYGSTPPARPAI